MEKPGRVSKLGLTNGVGAVSTPQVRIAARIRGCREALGISQEAVARKIPNPDRPGRSITLRTYARWERGESSGFMTRIGDLARALETTESELLGGEDPMTAQPTIEDLTAKLDQVLVELAELREDLGPRKKR